MISETPTTMSDRSGDFLKDILKGEAAFPTFSAELNTVLSGGLSPGKLYTLTVMVPNEEFAELIHNGTEVALDAEDLVVIRGG